MSDAEKTAVDESRRNLLKIGAGTVAGLGVVAGAGAIVSNRINGIQLDDFPYKQAPDFKPMDQRDVLLTYATSKRLMMDPQYAYRNQNFGAETGGPIQPGEQPYVFQKAAMQVKKSMNHPELADNNKIGYTQLDYALRNAAWHGEHEMSNMSSALVPNQGMYTWSQEDRAAKKYPFKNSEEKVNAIRAAARVFGASKVGITRRDRRWDYDPLYNEIEGKVLSWEEDFPFEPKTVIVMLVEMDYEAIATAPANPSSSTTGVGYSKMSLFAGSMAKFLRGVGYNAVGAGNDMGNSVAYAVSAGLGEAARNGCLITPKLGPRVRICKVYTDMELDEADYDKPRDYGITEFCTHCKRCAESCPSQCISHDDHPSMTANYPGADDPKYSWHTLKGVEKWHNDAKKCLKFWIDGGSDCSACIASCPWNKPDFWHHRLIDSMNSMTSGPIHTFMRQADIWFGYGNIQDEQAVVNFWKSGKDGDFS